MYLITGSNGQLGTELTKLLPTAIATDSDKLDITNKEQVNNFVSKHNIKTIINCAAYTNVDGAEDNKDLAEQINVIGSENLAKTGCNIVHISTDYVFNGKNYIPYKEDDLTEPLSVYGKTKLAGENTVLNNAENAIVIRTAWLYSSTGRNFVKTMFNLGKEKENINVVCDQVGTPTYARDLAETIVKILPKMSVENRGIYHFTNEGVCSWYDFAVEIMDTFNLNCKVKPIPTSEYPTKAKRPSYSVLDKTKIKKVFNIDIKHWKYSLKECAKIIKEN